MQIIKILNTNNTKIVSIKYQKKNRVLNLYWSRKICEDEEEDDEDYADDKMKKCRPHPALRQFVVSYTFHADYFILYSHTMKCVHYLLLLFFHYIASYK